MSGITTSAGRARSLLRLALIGAASLAGTLLWAGSADAAFPTGSNGKVIYVVNDASFDIWTMNADGSGKTNLTPNTDSTDEYNPAFSPDGKRIVFASNRPDSTGTDIWVMNADGSNPVNLTTGVSGAQELPAWSPDGKQIAYTDESVGGGDVFVMNTDGSAKTNLTPDNETQWDSQPNYSPDGMKIAFTRCLPGSPCTIWTMNADGSGKAQLTQDPNDVDNFAPSYSPDGKQVAYVYDTGPEDVAVAPATGGAGSVITAGFTQNRIVHPGWSPDGKRIAINAGTSSNSDTQDVWLINPDGSNPVDLTSENNTVGDVQPDWESVYSCRGKRATIVGTLGNDALFGTPSADVVVGFDGFDTVNAGGGKDVVCANNGGSKLTGAGGKDILVGGTGKDKLLGGKASDLLIGKKGKDVLNGGGGTDKCKGGAGKDKTKGCEKGKA